jgi:hypothetical protein
VMGPGQPVEALGRAADWEEGPEEEWEDEGSDQVVSVSVRPAEWRSLMNGGYRAPAWRVPTVAPVW